MHTLLKENNIHIWSTRLLQDPKNLCSQFACLSTEEKNRAAMFHFAKDRIKFIQCRYLLRSIISYYTNIKASNIEFCYGKYGKPELKDKKFELTFNLAHSHDFAVFAFSKNNVIGIDIEVIKEEDISWIIDTSMFTTKEIDLFNTSSDLNKIFYKLWSCKEAYVKALGVGLSMPLNNIEITFTNKQEVALASCLDNAYKSYYLLELQNLPTQYAGALAFPENTAQVQYKTI